MSRIQADQVALANDGSPFNNATFVKNCFAGGSIVPPPGEGASVRRTDFAVGFCVLCFVAAGAAFCIAAFLWR